MSTTLNIVIWVAVVLFYVIAIALFARSRKYRKEAFDKSGLVTGREFRIIKGKEGKRAFCGIFLVVAATIALLAQLGVVKENVMWWVGGAMLFGVVITLCNKTEDIGDLWDGYAR